MIVRPALIEAPALGAWTTAETGRRRSRAQRITTARPPAVELLLGIDRLVERELKQRPDDRDAVRGQRDPEKLQPVGDGLQAPKPMKRRPGEQERDHNRDGDDAARQPVPALGVGVPGW
jgi:hypothetical protein